MLADAEGRKRQKILSFKQMNRWLVTLPSLDPPYEAINIYSLFQIKSPPHSISPYINIGSQAGWTGTTCTTVQQASAMWSELRTLSPQVEMEPVGLKWVPCHMWERWNTFKYAYFLFLRDQNPVSSTPIPHGFCLALALLFLLVDLLYPSPPHPPTTTDLYILTSCCPTTGTTFDLVYQSYAITLVWFWS